MEIGQWQQALATHLRLRATAGCRDRHGLCPLSPHADAFKPQLPTAVVVALPCFASGKGRQIMQYVRAAN
jgi:hypothetical protein